MNLTSFHIVLVAVAIVLLAGVGVWGLMNAHVVLGTISIVVGIVVLLYGASFIGRSERNRIEL